VSKVRVYELAKELGVESKVVLAKLAELGEFVRSASSTIEAPVVRKLKDAMPPAEAAPARPKAKAKPKAKAAETPAETPTPAAPTPAPTAEAAPAPEAPAPNCRTR